MFVLSRTVASAKDVSSSNKSKLSKVPSVSFGIAKSMVCVELDMLTIFTLTTANVV